MRLDFSAIGDTVLPNFCGGEKELVAAMFSDDQNRILRGRLAPGASIGLHCHEESSEILYILEGRGCVLFDGQREPLEAGVCHYCPKGHEHSLINDSDADLVFFAVVPKQ
ncbi:MAG: cupin domain-containing protein [Acutalibacteraceae bacterium]